MVAVQGDPWIRVKGSPWHILALALVHMLVSPLHLDILLWPMVVWPFLHFLSYIYILQYTVMYYIMVFIINKSGLIAKGKNGSVCIGKTQSKTKRSLKSTQ